MSEFALWFWKPIAETLGAFVLVVIYVAFIAALLLAIRWWDGHDRRRAPWLALEPSERSFLRLLLALTAISLALAVYGWYWRDTVALVVGVVLCVFFLYSRAMTRRKWLREVESSMVYR